MQLFDSTGQLTSYGKLICQMLSRQLTDLPFHASIQFSDQKHMAALADMMAFLFDTEKTRPGQVAISFVKPEGLPPKTFAS